MSFLWPQVLWLALLAPALLGVQRWLGRRAAASGKDDVESYSQIRRGVVAGGRVQFDAAAYARRAGEWRLWLALVLVVVALARPQWGRVAEPARADAPGEVIIALDLSRKIGRAHD